MPFVVHREKFHQYILRIIKKQSEEEALIEKAVKSFIQVLYGKRIFDKYDIAVEVLKDYLLIEKPRPNLEEVLILSFNEKQGNVRYKHSTYPLFLGFERFEINFSKKLAIYI